MSSRWSSLWPVAALVITLWFLGERRSADSPATHDGLISGTVVDHHGPVAAASVRVKGSADAVQTDKRGRFQLAAAPDARLTAWKDGYFIAGAAANANATIELEHLPTEDFKDYHWVDPRADPTGEHNCANCHGEIFREWSAGGHARSAGNRHFLNLFDGSDWHGKPDRGWSLLADHPLGAGVCTSCHAPTVAFEDAAHDDLRKATGVSALGVHCDFCHKVQSTAEGEPGLAHGRFGLKLLRPAEGLLFFGPLQDVDRGEDAYSPLYHDSRYCASCHEGTVFGVHVYSTYSEWLKSPARAEGKQCQSCHMAPTGRMTNIAPGAGGIERDPWTLASHNLLPGGREAMLRRALKMNVKIESRVGRAERGPPVPTENVGGPRSARPTLPPAAAPEGDVKLTVILEARNVGHRVPTGFIDRHLLLLVEALDADGNSLELVSGPLMEQAGDASLTGRPGRLFAKLLPDRNGQAPIPFWRDEHGEAVDTRLVPREPVVSEFTFPADTTRVRVRLVYRRFWRDVSAIKAWPDTEIILADETLKVVPGEITSWRLPNHK